VSGNEQLARRVRELRTQLGWSHEQLAVALKAVGIPWTRHVVAKLENGRRQTLTIEELHGLAFVLDVPPLALLYPIGQNTVVEVLPGRTVDAWDAAMWFTGEARLPLMPGEGKSRYSREFVMIGLLRRHDELVRLWGSCDQSRDLMRTIRATREEMRGHGMVPPELPSGLLLR